MPILAAEPNLYPPDLFAGREPPPTDQAWWVLHTRPRQEKSLARQLAAARIPHYLPLTARRGVIRGRVLESHLPLFTGYLFLLAEPEQRLAALATKRVARAIPVPDQGALWRDLKQIELLISSGLPLTPEEKLGEGSRVVIRSGPLAGFRGTIIRSATGRRFVVAVDFIQRGASVTLDDFALLPADEAPA